VCRVPFAPRVVNWVSDMPQPRKGKKPAGDSEYSPWLGLENYHDPSTGQNYWVSPSTDWDPVGPPLQGAAGSQPAETAVAPRADYRDRPSLS
jgi:hypothetical protein